MAASPPDPNRTIKHVPEADVVTNHADDPAVTTDAAAPFNTSEPGIFPEVPGHKVTREIARGGMGRVLAAHDLTLDREVAIKVLLPGAAASAAARRFVVESKITAKLPHPNIPPVYQLGMLADGSPFLAMKLINGRTLADLLGTRPSPSHDLPRFVQAFEQVCQAVGFAHSHGIIHRDLKPANVMVGAFGEVQVMDWGLAREARNDAELTLAGAVMGTPAYMAPEQARGEDVDARADVFAMGAILCEILTGERVYSGKIAAAILKNAATAELSDALARLDKCGADAELIGVTKRCLSRDHSNRPSDAGAVAELVAAYRAGVEDRLRKAERERAAAEAKSVEQRKKRRVQLALGGAVGLLVIAFGAFAWWQDRQTSAEKARLARSGDTVEGLLDRVETAIRDDDAAAGTVPLAEAEKRLAEGGLEHLRERLDRCQAALDLLNELDRIDNLRLSTFDGHLRDNNITLKEMQGLFRKLGVAPGETSPSDAARLLNDSLVRERLLGALESWYLEGKNAPRAELTEILIEADPDPFRNEFRRAFASRNVAAVLSLVNQEAILSQPARFGASLGGISNIPMARRLAILSAVTRQRPKDFIALMTAGTLIPSNTASTADERISWYRAGLSVRSTNAVAWLLFGFALADKGDVEGAIAATKEAIRHDPKYAYSLATLGHHLDRNGDPDAAIAIYREAIRLDPKDSMAHNMLGYALRQKDLDGAIAAYREAIRLDSTNALAYANLGIALQNKNNLYGAIASLQEAVRLAPRSAEYYNYLGDALRTKQDLDAAIDAYRTSSKLDEKNYQAHFNLGNALRTKGDIDGAIRSYLKALILNPDSHVVHSRLGWIYFYTKNNRDLGLEHLSAAARLNGADPWSHNNFGIALRDSGRIDEAIGCFRRAIQSDPKFPYSSRNLGWILFYTKGDRVAGLRHFREGVRLSPIESDAQNELGCLLRDSGDIDGAFRCFTEAIRIDPQNSWPHGNLGYVLYQMGKYDAALPPIREALRLNPAFTNAYYYLGLVLQIKDDKSGAQVAYNEASRRNPELYGHFAEPQILQVAPLPRKVNP